MLGDDREGMRRWKENEKGGGNKEREGQMKKTWRGGKEEKRKIKKVQK